MLEGNSRKVLVSGVVLLALFLFFGLFIFYAKKHCVFFRCPVNSIVPSSASLSPGELFEKAPPYPRDLGESELVQEIRVEAPEDRLRLEKEYPFLRETFEQAKTQSDSL